MRIHSKTAVAVCLMLLSQLILAFPPLTTHPYALGSSTRAPDYVIISEVIPDPYGTDTTYEWVEVYNAGGTAVNITGWKFYDNGDNHTVYADGNPLPIPPGGYGVIARNVTAFLERYPWYSGPLYRAAISLPGSGDVDVRLYNGSVAVNYAVYNGSNASAYYSLELNDFSSDSNNTANWVQCLYEDGTPGYMNSQHTDGANTVPLIYGIDAPPYVFSGQPITISARIEPSTVSSAELRYRVDGGTFQSAAMLDDGNSPDTAAGDGKYTGQIPAQSAGAFVEYYIYASNSALSYKYPYYAPDAYLNYTVANSSIPGIVLNEFLANTGNVDYNGNGLIADSDDEYIEIYNNDTIAVDIGGWQIDDEEGGSSPYTIPSGTVIQPGQVMVFFSNVTGIGLNNGGDTVRLLTDLGVLVDSYAYGSVGDDVAYGRMPDGMGWTVLGSPSPGELNANVLYQPQINFVSIDPSAPESNEIVNITAGIYSYSGLASVTLNYTVNSGSEAVVPMTLNNGNYTASIGPFSDGDLVSYYVYAVDTNGNSTKSDVMNFTVRDYSTPVVVNEFLPAPSSDWNNDGSANSDDEFIELYNPSGSDVDMGGWMLDDVEGSSTPYVIPAGTIVPAGGFAVFFASQTSIGLNNGGDSVRLLAPNGRVWYEYAYTSSSANVSYGLYPDGQGEMVELETPTPGEANSPPVGATPSVAEVTITPSIPQPGQGVVVSARIEAAFSVTAVIHYRTSPSQAFSSVSMALEGTLYNATIPGQTAGTTVEFYIEASTQYATINYPAGAPAELLSYQVRTVEDMNLYSMKINEVMYNPAGSEYAGEWIELYNPTSSQVDMTGCIISDQDGDDDFVFPHFTFEPHAFAVVYVGPGNTTTHNGWMEFHMNKSSGILGNSGDDILLSDRDGTPIDYIRWGEETDTPPLGATWTGSIELTTPENYTLALIPDGADSNDSQGWNIGTPTPGAPNEVAPDTGPVISAVYYYPKKPTQGYVDIYAEVADNIMINAVTLHYRTYLWSDTPGTFSTMEMLDNATPSVTAHAGVYVEDNNILEFYITAEDNSGNVTTSETHKVLVSNHEAMVSINELLPDPGSDWNGDGSSNSDDEFIEICNYGDEPVDLHYWQLDDWPNGSSPYTISDFMLVPPGGFVVLYGSETGIGLNNNGEMVHLLAPNGTLVDNVTYNSSEKDISIGRYPDGTGEVITLAYPTPDSANVPPTPPRNATPEERKLQIVRAYANEAQKMDFVAIFNPLDSAIDLGGLGISDFEGEVRFLPGTYIQPHQVFYYAESAEEFHARMHFYPDATRNPGEMNITKVTGKGINLAADGDEVALLSPSGEVLDILVYGKSDYTGEGWNGPAVEKAGTGEMYSRVALTQTSYVDTNTSEDWMGLRRYIVGQSDLPLKTFSFNGTVTAFVSPDSSFSVIKEALDSAKESIYLNVYEISNLNLTNALADAARRGVYVSVFLEGGPVSGISEEEKYCLYTLHQAGVHIGLMKANEVSGVPARYRFDHAKYCVIDNSSVIIITENWKYTGVPVDPTYGNRGWGVKIDNGDVAAYFRDVFMLDSDQQWDDVLVYDPTDPDLAPDMNITFTVPTGTHELRYSAKKVMGSFKVTPVFAPDHTLLLDQGIIAALRSAKESIYVEQLDMDIDWGLGAKFAYNWSDPEHYYLFWDDGREHYNLYLKEIIDAARRGVKVRVILDSKYVSWDPSAVDNADTIQYLNKVAQLEGLDIQGGLADLSLLAVEKVHTKGFIVDNRTTFVSSINFAPYSSIYNRECGVLIENEEVAHYFADVFFYDMGYSNRTAGEPGYTYYNYDEQTSEDTEPGPIPAGSPIKHLDVETNSMVVAAMVIQTIAALVVAGGIVYEYIRRRKEENTD